MCFVRTWSPFDKRYPRAHPTNSRVSDDQKIRALQDMNQDNVSAFNTRDCPFCDNWADALHSRKDLKGKGKESTQSHASILVSSDRFQKHVATHLESLSVFALPRAIEEKGVDESKPTMESLRDFTTWFEPDLDLI